MSIMKPRGMPLAMGVSLLLSGQALAADFSCVTPVQSFSNLEKMSAGDFSANVLWKDVKLTRNSIGYGPGANRQYELTILDGQVYMARPDKDGEIRVRNDPKPSEGAAMLQIASPSAWGLYGELSEIQSFDDLNFELDMVADDLGCGEDVLLPFKISGHARSVTWSMDTHPPRVVTSRDQDVVILGLYNRNQKSKYFMVKGYNLHPHVVLTGKGWAGHLRDLDLEPGARLYLPAEEGKSSQ